MTTQRRKRVLMLLENNSYADDVRVRQEAEALLAGGFQVVVICPGHAFHNVANGVLVYSFPTPPGGDGLLGYVIEYGYSMLAMFVLSLFVLYRHGFDVVHAHNPPDTFVLIALLYKVIGKQFVFDQHDLSPELYTHARFSNANSLVSKFLTWFEILSYRVADHVIVTNESYRRIGAQRAGVSKCKVSVVRNGPDLRLFPVTPPNQQPSLGDCIHVAYMGVIGYQDGIEYLIRALHHLKYDFGRHDYRCTVMGRGAALAAARKLVDDLKLNETVTFTGWMTQKQIAEIMKTVDICVAPEPSNRYNDLSTVIKLMEYMAYGKAVVAFDLPEHRFTSQNTIVYARPNDPFNFAAQILCLMNDGHLRSTLGIQGRMRVEDTLEWSYQARTLVQVYENLALNAHRS